MYTELHTFQDSSNIAEKDKTIEHLVQLACKSAAAGKVIFRGVKSINKLPLSIMHYASEVATTGKPVLLNDSAMTSMEDPSMGMGGTFNSFASPPISPMGKLGMVQLY